MKKYCPCLAAGFALFLGSALQAQENHLPVVQILDAGPFAAEIIPISYVLYDAEEDPGSLHYALYAYPDNKRTTVNEIQTFGLMIADEEDLLDAKGSGDFAESRSETDVQIYTWGTPGRDLIPLGFAPLKFVLEGNFYLYLVADDGVNAPVFTVSAQPVRVDRSTPATAVAEITWGEVKAGRR